MTELTVACVLRSGGCYNGEYVRRLVAGVRENLHVEHRMLCLTDMDEAAEHCDVLPLITNWPGWFAKLELFRLTGSVLYFDLDTVIQGDITPLARYPHRFSMLSDFFRPQDPASGVMAWHGDYSRLFHGFSLDQIDQFKVTGCWGDQGYIAQHVQPERLPDLFPGMFASYKASSPAEKQRAAVICFHGHPRPHEVNWNAVA